MTAEAVRYHRFARWCSIIILATACALVSAEETVPVVRFNVTGFEVLGDNPLSESATQSILKDYIGNYEGLDALLSAVEALQLAISTAGFNFRRVILPPQTLAGAIVQLEVVSFHIGDIDVEGNEHFGKDNIVRSLPALRVGEAPDTDAIAQALYFANRHGDKQINVKLRESQEASAIDALITVEDKRPWSVFAGLNNIGTRATGRTRLSLGAAYSNLFNLDHKLTFSYTTSPENADDVTQASAFYELPVYSASGTLTAFYSYSDVNVGDVGDFSVSGAGRFWGLSFNRDLRKIGGVSPPLVARCAKSRVLERRQFFTATRAEPWGRCAFRAHYAWLWR